MRPEDISCISPVILRIIIIIIIIIIINDRLIRQVVSGSAV